MISYEINGDDPFLINKHIEREILFDTPFYLGFYIQQLSKLYFLKNSLQCITAPFW